MTCESNRGGRRPIAQSSTTYVGAMSMRPGSTVGTAMTANASASAMRYKQSWTGETAASSALEPNGSENKRGGLIRD